jgi:5-methyltetrahydrofolate--homocysteine methyltransferase
MFIPSTLRQKELVSLLDSRILLLDGAMGTMVQGYGLTESDFRGDRFINSDINLKGNNDVLALTQPQIIREIHWKYLQAGSDIIETDTFNANSISQKDYKLENICYEINLKAARIAREAADEFSKANPGRLKFVAGSIGPTNQTASMSQDVNNPSFRAYSFDDFVIAYIDQINGLIDGDVDIILIETVFDTLNCKAAIFAAAECFRIKNVQLPVMISGTIIDKSGRTLSGQTLEAFRISTSHCPNLLSTGLNCAMGSLQMKEYIEELSSTTDCYTSLYPNAGLPDPFGKYGEDPGFMAQVLVEYASEGLINIAGGCCGTTPDHIAAMAKAIEGMSPRKRPIKEKYLCLSGLEPLVLRPETNFVNIGERTNVAGSRKFARLIAEGSYEKAIQIARQQVESGSQIIDVSMDEAMLDSPKTMTTFLNYIASDPAIIKVPVMIDSSDWNVLEAGLKCLQGKGIVNSISLKEGVESFKEKARKIHQYGAAMVVMAFDEHGQAVDIERKIEVLSRSYKILTDELNIPAEDIILDANILTVATGMEEHNNYAVNFIEAVKWIKQNLPGASTSGGISNLSYSFRGNDAIREIMHTVFLYHAINAGLDMGIVNPGQIGIYEEIPEDTRIIVEDVIFNRHQEATERLVELATKLKDIHKINGKTESWRDFTIEGRLKHALINGIVDHIEDDIYEALDSYNNPLDIIEKPLMGAMDHVGELFGSGQMFLPQVVKAARVMKKAVEFLQPLIKERNVAQGTNQVQGKILLATVKGDVHDIGKNIVGVILACNNYDVIDLGVMVSAEKIVEEAINQKVDVIGLSGLITPSLEEMINVAKEMERRKMSIPLIISGATTSRLHTAVRIDTQYSGPVVYVNDASKSIPIVNNLLNPVTKNDFIRGIKDEYSSIRNHHEQMIAVKELLPIITARSNKLKLDWNSINIIPPKKRGITVFRNYPLTEISEFIDWSEFFNAWEVKGHYPELLDNAKTGDSAQKLFTDANTLLDKIIAEDLIVANAVIGLYPANSVGDDVEVYDNENQKNVLGTYHFLRQQSIHDGKPNLCLADYIAPKESGRTDYIGSFAVTTGIGSEKLAERYKESGDDYYFLLVKLLADRLAEAFTELLHSRVRNEFWGYEPDTTPIEDCLKNRYSGIRPAPGYPTCPDHTEKRAIFDLLSVEENTGITLLDSFMMIPASSVCGLFFVREEAVYFPVGKIGKDQAEDYAVRKTLSYNEIKKWLAQNLIEN